MDVIESRAQTQSPQFAENRKSMAAVVSELKDRLTSVRQGGSPERVELHRSRGKMLVRDRIEALLDRDTPFLELSPLAAWGMYDNEENSAGIVTGVRVVHEKEVGVVAHACAATDRRSRSGRTGARLLAPGLVPITLRTFMARVTASSGPSRHLPHRRRYSRPEGRGGIDEVPVFLEPAERAFQSFFEGCLRLVAYDVSGLVH